MYFRPNSTLPSGLQSPKYHKQPLQSPQRHSQVLISDHKLQHINSVIGRTDQLGGLYLGDIICTIKPDILKANNIGALVSCLGQETLPSGLRNGNLVCKMVPAHDSLDYPISLHFQECFQFIEKMRKQHRNVLIHCHAGVSRSVTIVCAYLMLKENYSPEKALSFIRDRRERAKPNINFWNQLLNFHQSLLRNKPLENESKNKLKRKGILKAKKQMIFGHENDRIQETQERVRDNLSFLVEKTAQEINDSSNGRSSVTLGKKKPRIPWDKKKPSHQEERKTEPDQDQKDFLPEKHSTKKMPISFKKLEMLLAPKYQPRQTGKPANFQYKSISVIPHNSSMPVQSLRRNEISIFKQPSQIVFRQN